MARKPTITDVARTAGVGLGTVSRVINRAASVSDAMRRRVEAAMARLRYAPAAPQSRPGPKQRPSATRPTATIELVVFFRMGLGWMEEQAPVYAQVFDGIEAEAARAGMTLTVRQIDRWPEDYTPLAADTAGLVLFGSSDMPVRPPGFAAGLPHVWVLGTPPVWYAGDAIHIDHAAVGQLVAAEALRFGHEHCAWLGSCTGSPASRIGYRADAVRHHLEHAGRQVRMLIDPGIVRISRTTNVADADRIMALLEPVLRGSDRPTFLGLQADMLAPAVYACLARLGLRPQADVQIVTCNNEARYLRRLRPSPDVVDVRAVQVGEEAVRRLAWRMRNPAAPTASIALQPIVLGR